MGESLNLCFCCLTLLVRLHVDAFVNMLGEEETSWGLSHKGLLWHAGRHKTYIKPFRWSEPRFLLFF